MKISVAEQSLEIYEFILSNFYDIVDEDFRKEVRESMKKSEEIINKRKPIEEKVK